MWSAGGAKCARGGRWSSSCRLARDSVVYPDERVAAVVAMPVPWPTTDDGGHAKVSCNKVPAMRTGQR